MIQRWIDSSISKTVNAPKGYSVEQVEKVYERFTRVEQKVVRSMLMVSRDTQVLTLKAEENQLDDTL